MTPLGAYTVNQKIWDSSGWYYIDRRVFTSGKARVRILSQTRVQVVADAALFSKLGHGYKLQLTSPPIDAGHSGGEAFVKFDYFGNVRRPAGQGGIPDLGIHEAR
jgi:hypothetical protein